MQKKKHQSYILLTLGLIVVPLVVTSIFFFFSRLMGFNGSIAQAAAQNAKQGENSTKKAAPLAAVGLPVRLKIARIGVDAPIGAVGITLKGAMGSPKGASDVAWYKYGARPGQMGSAVLAGHYGWWKAGGGSVFDRLRLLARGDLIEVVDDKGVSRTFVVSETRLFDPTSDTRTIFGTQDNKSRLNLITCEGVWNEKTQSYAKRLVVFAVAM